MLVVIGFRSYLWHSTEREKLQTVLGTFQHLCRGEPHVELLASVSGNEPEPPWIRSPSAKHLPTTKTHTNVLLTRNRNIPMVSCWAAFWTIGFRIPPRAGNFSLYTVSRPALGPIQPPMQRVQGDLFLGVKRPEREADHSPHLVPSSRMRGATPPLPQ
jgi:hypothetical protein